MHVKFLILTLAPCILGVAVLWQSERITIGEIFGASSFFLHIAAYAWYIRDIIAQKILPNISSWLMWLFGAWIEYLTYNSITGSHWSTSALPFACALGMSSIVLVILLLQINQRRSTSSDIRFVKPEKVDYLLITFDVTAAAIWLFWDAPEFANIVAVSTSIVTFIPIWRSTYKAPTNERFEPWALWSCAYLAMAGAVVLSGNTEINLAQLFYPLYYFVLHAVVLILAVRTGYR